MVYRPRGPRPSRARGPLQCGICNRVFRQRNYFLDHINTAHDIEIPVVPPYDPPVQSEEDDPDGADQLPPAAPPFVGFPPVKQVDHTLSGAPAGPYWDWDKAADGHKARTALPDIGPMGLPKCLKDEYNAQMEFIQTKCKPILEGIDANSAVKPENLHEYEKDKAAFEECTGRRMLFTG